MSICIYYRSSLNGCQHTEISLPISEFLDTELAQAIKPTPQNKGNNTDSKYQPNGRDLRYVGKYQQNIFLVYFFVIPT